MKLNTFQKQIINFKDGNLAVIATAGSGKTTILTKRIEHLIQNGVRPNSILAVTFSNKSCESINDKLKELCIIGVQVETFHSLALKIIHQAYGDKYRIWTNQQEKEQVIRNTNVPIEHQGNMPSPYDIFLFIGHNKINMRDPNDAQLPSGAENTNLPAYKTLYQSFMDYQKAHNLIEFDDFFNIAIQILESNMKIAEFYHKKIQYVLVDEYQDISMSQSLLLHQINETNTMVVGDPLQSIYSFRGANNKFLLDFTKEYKNATVLRLNTNYRCSQEIVDISNTFSKSLTGGNIRATSFTGNCGPVHLLKNRNSLEETERIVREIKPNQTVGILARTNGQLQDMQSQLTAHNMPFTVYEGTSFVDSEEIKIIVNYLKLAADPNNDDAFLYVYDKPDHLLKEDFIDLLKEKSAKHHLCLYDAMITMPQNDWRYRAGIKGIRTVVESLKEMNSNIHKMIQFIRKQLNLDYYWRKITYDSYEDISDKIDNMNAFESLSKNFNSLESFLYHMDEVNKNHSYGSPIQLMTIHKAKGLEFDQVFIIGVNDMMYPHFKSVNSDEEKYLFYVALTRAKKDLWISCTQKYQGQTVQMSPYIDSIRDHLILKRRSRGAIEK